MLTFNFHGKNSYIDFGIYVEKRPTITSPKRRVDYITIPARNGSLKYDENTYEDITITLECAIKGDVTSISDIKAWLLSNASGELYFSYDLGKVYKAQVVNSIDFEIVLRQFSKFIIVFNAEPFIYLTSPIRFEYPLENGENEVNLVNVGTVYSEPTFEITAQGNVNIKINDSIIKLSNMQRKVFISSSLKEVYSEADENMNHLMEGEFPVLELGKNIINVTGDVSEFIIHPNWRWL